MSARQIITAPAVEPLTIAEVKGNCRINLGDNSDESVILETAAVARVSASTFTVVGDRRKIYSPGRYLALDQTTDATGYVAAAPTFDSVANKTTVRFSGTVDSGLASVSYGDGHLAKLIAMARDIAEQHQRRSLITQTLDLFFDGFPEGDALPLHASPIQSVASLKYTDSDGVEHTVDTADYSVDLVSIRPQLVLGYGKSWPSATLRPMLPVVARVVAGYGDSGDAVPASTWSGMMLLVSSMYEYREDIVTGTIVSKMPRSAEYQLDREAIVELP
ncbi:MAG: hypothetical protein OEV73_00460 [Desulfobulbaceae bacterium]|nr:hypothetical protein [Desulfobulbaceae bacterium]